MPGGLIGGVGSTRELGVTHARQDFHHLVHEQALSCQGPPHRTVCGVILQAELFERIAVRQRIQEISFGHDPIGRPDQVSARRGMSLPL